ncbi:hypothetical protein GCM10027091_08440 [Streptomyces daliensis]
MSSTVFDSALFRDMFGTSRMRTVFSDGTYLETLTRVEVALARAQARVGVVRCGGERFGVEVLHHAGHDGCGFDHADRDPEAGRHRREGLHQALDGELRGAVRVQERLSDDPSVARDGDDPPGAGFPHRRQHMPRERGDAQVVDVELLPQSGVAQLLQRAEGGAVGVVDENVDLPELGRHLVQAGTDPVVVRDVQGPHRQIHVLTCGFGAQRGRPAGVPHRRHDVQSLVRQAECGVQADPARRPRDHRDFSVRHVGSLPQLVRSSTGHRRS